jgi:hypothetical protein
VVFWIQSAEMLIHEADRRVDLCHANTRRFYHNSFIFASTLSEFSNDFRMICQRTNCAPFPTTKGVFYMPNYGNIFVFRIDRYFVQCYNMEEIALYWRKLTKAVNYRRFYAMNGDSNDYKYAHKRRIIFYGRSNL